MTDKQTEALKLALEALEWINRVNAMEYEYQQKARESLNAIYEALAEQPAQQQEPVALGYMNAGHVHEMQQGRLPYGYVYPKGGAGADVAIYTSPPNVPTARANKPLTDERIEFIRVDQEFNEWAISEAAFRYAARAIEAAHGIKGDA